METLVCSPRATVVAPVQIYSALPGIVPWASVAPFRKLPVAQAIYCTALHRSCWPAAMESEMKLCGQQRSCHLSLLLVAHLRLSRLRIAAKDTEPAVVQLTRGKSVSVLKVLQARLQLRRLQ